MIISSQSNDSQTISMNPGVWTPFTHAGCDAAIGDLFPLIARYFDYGTIVAFRATNKKFRNSTILTSAENMTLDAAKATSKAISIWIRFWLGKAHFDSDYEIGSNYFRLNNCNIVEDLNAYHKNPCRQTLANLFQNSHCFEIPFFCTQDDIDNWIANSCQPKNLEIQYLNDIEQEVGIEKTQDETMEEFIDANKSNIKKFGLFDSGIEHLFLPIEFTYLSSLKRLSICDQNLIGFSSSILENFSNLKSLRLHGTLIGTLPPSIGNLHSLEHLSLSSSQLELIPNELGNLKNLKYFILKEPLMHVLPNAISKLANLRILWIQESKCKTFPINLDKLTKLETILLINNKNLTQNSFDSIMKNPGSLQEFWFGFNFRESRMGIFPPFHPEYSLYRGSFHLDREPPVLGINSFIDYYKLMTNTLERGPYSDNETDWENWLHTRYHDENNPFRIVSADDIQEVDTTSSSEATEGNNKRKRDDDPDHLAHPSKKQKLD